MTEDVLFEEMPAKHGKLGCITLNRPAVLNALTHEMCLAITAHLEKWRDQELIKAVLVRGAGERAFCAGGDLVASIHALGPTRLLAAEEFFVDEYHMNRLIFDFPKPYLSFLDGITMGGGLGVSVHASHPIGTEKTLMAMPETGIGFFPDVGATYFLSRLPHHYGIYLGLTGARMSAGDARFLELVSHVVRSDQLSDIVDALRETVWGDNPMSQVDALLEQFVQPHSAALVQHQSSIDRCFGQQTVEDIIAALDQEDTVWAQETKDRLAMCSPMSLKVTHAVLVRARERSFDACMAMEYRLSCQFLRRHDFYEGIRALLIEKDKMPVWQPKTLEEIDAKEVEVFFE